MPNFSVFDLVAVILLVLYTLRKLEVSRRTAQSQPQVPPESFQLWKDKQLAAYRLGSWACFLKLTLGFALPYFEARLGAFGLLRITGFVVDFSWFVAMILAAVFSYRANKLSVRLGLNLSQPAP